MRCRSADLFSKIGGAVLCCTSGEACDCDAARLLKWEPNMGVCTHISSRSETGSHKSTPHSMFYQLSPRAVRAYEQVDATVPGCRGRCAGWKAAIVTNEI